VVRGRSIFAHGSRWR